MKKQYFSPSYDMVTYASEDIITASTNVPYAVIDEGNGEWLNWSDMKNS